MYAKCGDMGMAIQMFNMLMYKDIVSWSTIISGLAMNGLGVHTLPLFSLMVIHGVPPDDVTFIGLISTAMRGRMIDQGLMFFKAMTDVYRIEPQVQHYACIVDMYGRAGLLKEAEAFIKKMPVEADGIVWGALLNACRIHGNEEMFGQITRCLPTTEGVSIGTYALLSNTYASSRRWGDANAVRDVMRTMGLKKKARWGRKFGSLCLSPLGCLPALRAANPIGNEEGGCFEEACALVLAHNNALKAVLTSLEHLFKGFKYCNSNFYGWLEDRINNPWVQGRDECMLWNRTV
ncbi:putative pentatricopeptide repeat-containing protein [Camellia lanceoleosa]|uniref:Pentatricopeptide repeat-containing protein n=1 Tax=Camellia lanceoleosa TaxID=1840588 RepID=A0ACC0GLS0_9ERIC|nr:putative pentatricopeptide repeat-containing protein [Camellia lanceoleosa]